MSRVIRKELLSDFLSFWIIVSVAMCLGLLLNQLRDKPLPLIYQTKNDRMNLAAARIANNRFVMPIVAPVQGNLSLDEFQKFVEQKRGLILDARPEVFHRLGHVPGALSLPRDDFEQGYARLKVVLEADKTKTLVVYCSGYSCEDSEMVQKALLNLGYSRVFVYHGGWDEWTEAGLPEEKSQ